MTTDRKNKMKQAITLLALTALWAPAHGAAGEAEKNGSQAQGFVAIRLFSNTPDMQPHTWTHVTVLSAADKEYKLEVKASDSRHTSRIFAGYLPEGSYRLKGMLGMQSTPETGPGFDFAIRPGALTNLGTLIYQPIGQGKATFVTYPGQADLARAVWKEFPALDKELGDPVVSGWRQTAVNSQGASGQALPTPLQYGAFGALLIDMADKKNETEKRLAWTDAQDPALRLMLSKTSTYSLNAVQELADGELLAGSNLGQLLVRSKSGEWSNIDIGDAREITALHAYSATHIIVGGEDGLLKQTMDAGRTWTDLAFPVENALIAHIHESNGELLVMSLAQGRMTVHGRLDKPGSQWTELVNLPGMNTMSHTILPKRAALHKGKYLLLIPGKALHAFDLAKRSWTVSPVPSEIQEISSNGESLYSSTMLQKPHVSLDDGASWSKAGNVCGGFTGLIFDFGMRDKDQAWALCKVSGAFVATSRVRYSPDGGRNWTDQLAETAWQSFRIAVTKSVVVYIDRDARLFSSSDGGRTWKQDTRKVPDGAPVRTDSPVPVQAK